MHLDRPDRSFEFIVWYSLVTLHVIRSVSVVTHKLIEFNKTCMDAILKALSTVMNESRRNEVFAVLKQLKYESTVKTLTSHQIIIFM